MSRHETDELIEALERAENVGLAMLAENEDAQRHFLWSQQNRIGLLWIHVWLGVFAGAAMLVFGTAFNIEDTIGLWTRAALGITGIVGGGCLAIGLTRQPSRSIPHEVIGLVLLGLWDLAIAAGFIVIAIESPPQAAWPWEPLPQTTTRPYPIPVYLGILGLLALHVYTLRGLFALRRI